MTDWRREVRVFHGNQYTGGKGGAPAAAAPATTAGAKGTMDDPSPLPKGVKSSPGSIRNDVKKTLGDTLTPQGTKSIPLSGKDLGQSNTGHTVAFASQKTGNKVDVHPLTNDRHSIAITGFKKKAAAEEAVTKLKSRGYQMDDSAMNAMGSRIDFTVKA
jgi:hypothetical protein